jgi:hypothetical protein
MAMNGAMKFFYESEPNSVVANNHATLILTRRRIFIFISSLDLSLRNSQRGRRNQQPFSMEGKPTLQGVSRKM